MIGNSFSLLKRLSCGAALLAGCAVLPGCALVKDAYMVDSLTTGPGYEQVVSGPGNTAQMVPPPFNIYEDGLSGDPVAEDAAGEAAGSGEKRKTAYARASESKEIRNKLMGELVLRSKIICEAHQAAIISNSSTANFGLSEMTTVLSGLGSILTPASTVRALSGSAAITNATRSSMNEIFYQNLLATAIVKSIDEMRLRKYAALSAKRDNDHKQYTVDEMLADVVDYHQACSFYSGLVTLTKASERINASSEEIRSRLTLLGEQMETNVATLTALKSSPAPAATDVEGVARRSQQIANLESAIEAATSGIAVLTSQLALTPAASK
ncbi:MAG: hypothetical protein RH982_12070 [Parvibaculum sp.]